MNCQFTVVSCITALSVLSCAFASPIFAPPSLHRNRRTSLSSSVRPSADSPSAVSAESVPTESEVNYTATAGSASNSIHGDSSMLNNEEINGANSTEELHETSGNSSNENETLYNSTAQTNCTENLATNETPTETDDPCEIPADIHLRFAKILETMDPQSSLLYLPSSQDLLNRTYTEEDIFKSMENVKRYMWKKDSAVCSARTINDVPRSGDLEDRSLCPWYYVLDVNPFRYPPVLVSTECQCAGCVEYGDDFQCEKVTYDVPVLRRQSNQCVNGFYEYKQETETRAFGCACVKKINSESITA